MENFSTMYDDADLGLDKRIVSITVCSAFDLASVLCYPTRMILEGSIAFIQLHAKFRIAVT